MWAFRGQERCLGATGPVWLSAMVERGEGSCVLGTVSMLLLLYRNYIETVDLTATIGSAQEAGKQQEAAKEDMISGASAGGWVPYHTHCMPKSNRSWDLFYKFQFPALHAVGRRALQKQGK